MKLPKTESNEQFAMRDSLFETNKSEKTNRKQKEQKKKFSNKARRPLGTTHGIAITCPIQLSKWTFFTEILRQREIRKKTILRRKEDSSNERVDLVRFSRFRKKKKLRKRKKEKWITFQWNNAAAAGWCDWERLTGEACGGWAGRDGAEKRKAPSERPGNCSIFVRISNNRSGRVSNKQGIYGKSYKIKIKCCRTRE